MPRRESPPGPNCRFVVDGIQYGGVHSVYREALARGFNGCMATIFKRLKAGADTFALVAAPIPDGKRRSGQAAQSAKKREMQHAIAALDARKRAMGLIP